MKKNLILALSLFIAFQSQALSPYKASYDLYASSGIGSLKIGNVEFGLEVDQTEFKYTSEASTASLWKTLFDYKRSEKSVGLLSNDDLLGSYYRQFELKDGEVENDFEINIFSAQNYATFNNEKTWKVRPGSIVDELSVYLALSYHINKYPNVESLVYQVANEEGIKTQKFIIDGTETVKVNGKELETIKVLCPEMSLTLNLSEEYNYLPVRISKINGSHFKLMLSDYEQAL